MVLSHMYVHRLESLSEWHLCASGQVMFYVYYRACVYWKDIHLNLNDTLLKAFSLIC